MALRHHPIKQCGDYRQYPYPWPRLATIGTILPQLDVRFAHALQAIAALQKQNEARLRSATAAVKSSQERLQAAAAAIR